MSGNPLERKAAREIIDLARAVGVPEDKIAEVEAFCTGPPVTSGARLFFDLHPQRHSTARRYLDCDASREAGDGLSCTCWEPVFDVEQAEPDLYAVPWENLPDGLEARATRCGDCAFRRDSQERTSFEEMTLLDLPRRGEAFYCHDGMRRPVAYRHPRFGEVCGDPDDWAPLILAGVAFRIDGRPALLCSGWSQARRLILET